jgi:hypothetical protein
MEVSDYVADGCTYLFVGLKREIGCIDRNTHSRFVFLLVNSDKDIHYRDIVGDEGADGAIAGGSVNDVVSHLVRGHTPYLLAGGYPFCAD